jgi:YhcN/YlaJ family sporulation lipoprotein
MRKRILALTAGVLLSTMLVGCSEKQGDLGNKNIRSNSIRYDANGNLLKDKRFANDQLNEMNRKNGRRLNSNNLIGSHKNYRLEMSEIIAEEVMKMEEIKSSCVMLTDVNAYVAVSLDEAWSAGGAEMMSRTNMGLEGNDGVEMNKRMSSLSTGNDKLDVQIKGKIENMVRRLKPDVNQVYVSADPEFVVRMNAYRNDVRQGRSIQGYIAEFNAMAERIFPPKSGENGAGSLSARDKQLLYD